MLRLWIAIIIFFCSSYKLYSINLEIDILNNNYAPIPVVMVDFYADDNSTSFYENIKEIIFNNLDKSGVFDTRQSRIPLISRRDESLLETELNISRYMYYHYIISGKMIVEDGMYKIEVIVVDTFNSAKKAAFSYSLIKEDLSRNIKLIAGDISNEIYKSITGLQGYFNTKLTFVEDKNTLMIANYDGSNAKKLIRSLGQIYGPVFSPNGRYIAYVDFKDGKSKIHIYDLIFNKSIQLANLQGLSLSPRFSLDSSKILFSIAYAGAANIYEITIVNKKITKLTNVYSINLAGGYSKNGQQIIFNSDRIGTPHIYTMGINGKNVRRITKSGGAYYNPSFSPKGDIILATKVQKGNFYIVVVALDGRERVITKDTHVESPNWLQDGRHVIYQYRYSGSSRNPIHAFYILDIISGFKLPVKPGKNVQDPSFSNNFDMPNVIRKENLLNLNG